MSLSKRILVFQQLFTFWKLGGPFYQNLWPKTVKFIDHVPIFMDGIIIKSNFDSTYWFLFKKHNPTSYFAWRTPEEIPLKFNNKLCA